MRRPHRVQHLLQAGLLAAAAWVPDVGAQDLDNCSAVAAAQDGLTRREETILRLVELPETCLKQLFHGCSALTDRSVLDTGDAMVCSLGYEALLRRSFGGDFSALLAWWQAERSGRRGAGSEQPRSP